MALVVSDCAQGALEGSLLDSSFVAVDREVCWKTVACRSCVRRSSFAGVIMDVEMMPEWAAEQPKEITMSAIDLEFLPTDANKDRGVQNVDFVLQQTHTALVALTSCEANDIVANSRKIPLEAWRRLRKRPDSTAGGRKRNLHQAGGSGVIGAKGIGETSDPQLESLANIGGCAPRSSDVRGGEVRFENS